MKLSISVSSLKIAGCVIFFRCVSFAERGFLGFFLEAGPLPEYLNLPKSDLEKADKKFWRNFKNLVLPLFGEFCCTRSVLST